MPTVTPAQKARLQQVKEGRIEKRGDSRAYASYYNSGFGGKGTYIMWCNLEDAGLIEWAPVERSPGDTLRPLFRAVLTEAGKLVLS